MSEKEGVYSYFKLINSRKSLNLKLYYNLEKLRKSEIIEILEKEYDYPTVVLFGSFKDAIDDENSDIDICLITNIDKKISLEKYDKTLNRNISIHRYSKKDFDKMKQTNKGLINSIANGIVLSGELEIL